MATNIVPVYDDVTYFEMQEFPFVPSEDKFFHYTSAETCLKMLKNKVVKNKDDEKMILELWATHTRFMNDSQEMLGGCECIKSILTNSKQDRQNIAEKFDEISPKTTSDFNVFASKDPNHYSISFCGDTDLLSQWMYYGAKTGVAIEYDLNNCLLKGDSSNVEEWFHAKPYKILYENDEKEKQVNKILNVSPKSWDIEYDSEIKALQLLYLSSFMKDKAYCEESESRLLFTPYYTIGEGQNEKMNKVLSLIEFRENNGIILPYLPIQIKHIEDDKFPIKSITIGPGRNQEFVFNALILFVQSKFQTTDMGCEEEKNDSQFESYKIGDIILRRSLIPFRG